MASEISNPPPAVSASARQAAKVKSYVNQQLEKTRKQVKIVDLIAGGLVLIAFVVGFLILAALVDGWIWPLSRLARWGCLVFLIFGCVAYTLIAIVPLLLKRINPDYAAKMIEEAKPSFKNSLLNYVSLRKQPESIKPAIFDAVSRQAAANLATVPEDATVDRSKLIRLGFVLVGLTLFVVGYKMLSPKDPLQTVARIVFPSGKIAKPAVVRIEDVQPGDTKVFFGEQLEVTAIVRGSHSPEDVRLVYSTLDGQLVDQAIIMSADRDSNQYRAELSMAGGGIQQSLTYQVIARDGASPEYKVTVQPNPAIAIESLVLQPPAYTKMRERTLVGQGDIDAIEGTKVTVHAVANLPIQLAYIELLNEVTEANEPISELDYDSRYRLAATAVQMESDGKFATGSFLAALNSSGDRPIASHYRIRFVSTEDDRNRQPNVYPIRIIPDLAPEIRFRNPDTREIEIPVNGDFPILLEANDLDFEIRSVHLKIEHAGERRLDQSLELNSADGNRRVTASYRLRPADLGLKEGDTAIFYGSADDNRMSHYSDQPNPNTSRTENYTLRVTASNESAEKDPNKNGDSDQTEKPEAGEKDKGDDGGDKGDNGSKKGEDESGSDPSEKPEKSAGDEKGSETGDQSETPSESGSDQKNPNNEAGQKNSEQQESGEPGKEKNPESGENGKADSSEQSGDGDNSGSGGSATEKPDQPPEGGGEGTGEGGESAGQGQGSKSEENSPGNKNNSSSDSGDNSSTNSGGDSPNPADGDPQSNPDSPGGSKSGDGQKDDSLTNGAQEAVSDNASESELIRKMQEHFENEQNDSKNKNEQNDSSQSADPKDGSQPGDNSNQTGQGQKTDDGEPGDKSTNPAAANKPDGEKTAGSGTGQAEDKTNGEQADPLNQAGSQSPTENQDPSNPETKETPAGEPGSGDPNSGKPGDDKPENGESGKKDPGASEPENTKSKSTDSESGKPDAGTGEPETGKSKGDESGKSEPEEGDSSKGESGKGESESDKGEGESGKGESGKGESGKGESGKSESGKVDSGNEGSGKDEAESGSAAEGNPGGKGTGEAESNSSGSEQNGDSQTSGEQPPADGEKKPGSNPGSSTSGNKTGAGPHDQQRSPNLKDPGGTGKGVSSAEGDLLEREEANLDHAKKATDLILNKLSEQKNDPDPELLRKLKMSKEELQEFFDRWDEMKRKAESGNVAAQKKYERELKSLGLKPKGGSNPVQQNRDKVEGLNEDGAVNEPTAELVPDFNAFLRDLGRVRDN